MDGAAGQPDKLLDEEPAKARPPIGVLDAEGAKLQAVGMPFEGDDAREAPAVLGEEELVLLHSGIIHRVLPGERSDPVAVLRGGLSDFHERVL